jgi:hypothetical protein
MLLVITDVESLNGTYLGIVVNPNDPAKLGRVKVRVPSVFGPTEGDFQNVADDDLPWAFPVGLPAGGTADSGSIAWLPEAGDRVFVRFLDGEPEKPVWEWGMQNFDQRKRYEVHSYEENGAKTARARISRYQHTFDIEPELVRLQTRRKFTLEMLDTSEEPTEKQGVARMAMETGTLIELNQGSDSIFLKANESITEAFKTRSSFGQEIESYALQQQTHVAPLFSFQGLLEFKVGGVEIGAFGASLASTPLLSVVHNSVVNQTKADAMILNKSTGVHIDDTTGVHVIDAASIMASADSTIFLSVGGRTLAITSSGFDFF